MSEEIENIQVDELNESESIQEHETETLIQETVNVLKGHELLEADSEIPDGSTILEPKPTTSKSELIRHTKLPMSRIKSIMKMDPDVALVNADAVFLATKATELFIEILAKESYSLTVKNKKKTITKKDLDTVIDTVDCLCFLEGAMDF